MIWVSPGQGGAQHLIRCASGMDRTSIAASEDKLGSGNDDSATLPWSAKSGGGVAWVSSRADAMLSRSVESVGLHWRPLPSPKRSRLDYWFLGGIFPGSALGGGGEVLEGTFFSPKQSYCFFRPHCPRWRGNWYVEIPPVEHTIGCSFARGALPPGWVIHASACSSPRTPSCCLHLLQRGPSSSPDTGCSLEQAAGKRRSQSLPLPGPWSTRASGIPGIGKPYILLDSSLRDALPSGSDPCALLRCYVGGSPSPTCSVSGGLASTPQTGLLAHENYQTRLCDSVRPASSQLQGHSVHYCAEPGYSRLASGDHGPTGEGCNRAGPSSQGFAALTSLYPIKAVGYDQSWTCTSWIRPLSSSRSRC